MKPLSLTKKLSVLTIFFFIFRPAFHPVTPVDCAQRGFRLEEADLVRCVSCPAALSGRLASSDVTGARERSVEALRKNLGRFPLP